MAYSTDEEIEKAAEDGDPDAQYVLAQYYETGVNENGFFSEKDLAKAFEWYYRAAEYGSSDEWERLGNMMKKNPDKVIEWYSEMAERRGLQNAAIFPPVIEVFAPLEDIRNASKLNFSYTIGYIYSKAEGEKQDPAKAFEWFSKVVEKNKSYNDSYNFLKFCLGYIQHKTKGKIDKPSNAFKWFCETAENGDVVAQYCLGYIYNEGYGTKRDVAKAIEWYSKAAEQGYADAKEALDRLKSKEN